MPLLDMSILDSETKIKRLDKSNMIGSIGELGLQCHDAWQATKKVKVPAGYKKVKNIVINGMGGSGLGGDIIQFLFWDKLKIPLQVVNSYTLPASVDRNTLFIASSYSGNTEEVISTIPMAQRRGAKILLITKGGKMGRMIEGGKYPGYLIDEQHNPCGQPRMGIGYSVFGQLGLFARCDLINIKDSEVSKVIKNLENFNRRFGLKITKSKNLAKQTAEKLAGKIPCIVAADFLTGNAHAFRNQINENSKNFATYFIVSEMNHHLMEGLGHPKKAKKNLKFLFLQSKLYHPKNQKRIEITKEVVENNSIDFIEHELKSKTKLEQSFEALLFGSYVNFYLSMLNGIDPSPIPWVDYFKEKLG